MFATLRHLRYGLILAVSLPACGAAPAQIECTILAVREQVLAEQRGGPQPAEDDGTSAAAAQGTVYRASLKCGSMTHFAVFTPQNGFDAATFRKGTPVAVAIRGNEIRISVASGAVALGRLTASH